MNYTEAIEDPEIGYAMRTGYGSGAKANRCRAIAECEVCGEPIYENDSYYKIGRLVVCTACVEGGYVQFSEEDFES